MTHGARPVVLVGCGRMGGALLSGFLRSEQDVSHFHVVCPNRGRLDAFLPNGRITWHGGPESLPPFPGGAVYIFAVKPQVLGDVLPAYGALMGEKDLCVSVAAGKTIDFFQGFLGDKPRYVRAFPNTPAAIGQGIFLCYTPHADDRSFITQLLTSLGSVHWFDHEETLHPAASLAASGPAFVFQFVESLIEAGTHLGLSPSVARELSIELFIGSAAYLGGRGQAPADLCREVASPQGMTAAGLGVLQGQGRLTALLIETLFATVNRSRELGA